MHNIHMDTASLDFQECWASATQFIDTMLGSSDAIWIKIDLSPPFLEHFSFRLGNQLFFVRIVDTTNSVDLPGQYSGLLFIADECRGHPVLMPMEKHGGQWRPALSGWGLVDARRGERVDPPSLVSDQLIEMTDWELHDFAVQVVRSTLENRGRELMSHHGNPSVDPSLWFIGDSGPEWVVVRGTRFPALRADRPDNLGGIRAHLANHARVGHFASVSVASADDAFDAAGGVPPTPLWRGHPMIVRFHGLEAVEE